MLANGHTEARKLRSRLNHPIIDADGHWAEFAPLMREEFRRIGKAAAQLVECGDCRFESRALAAEGLRLLRRVPDRRIRELVTQLFEALALCVVLKGTPSAPSGAP